MLLNSALLFHVYVVFFILSLAHKQLSPTSVPLNVNHFNPSLTCLITPDVQMMIKSRGQCVHILLAKTASTRRSYLLQMKLTVHDVSMAYMYAHVNKF